MGKFAILTLLLLGVAVARRGGRGPKQCSDGPAPTCSDGEPPKEPCSDGNRPSCPEGETLVGRGRRKRCSGGGNPTCSDGADPVRPCDQGKPNTCPDGGRPQPCPRNSWVCCDGSTPVFDGTSPLPHARLVNQSATSVIAERNNLQPPESDTTALYNYSPSSFIVYIKKLYLIKIF